MIFIREINPLSLKLLERIYRQSRHHQVQTRAHCLILALQGVKTEELSKILCVSYKTIYNWLNQHLILNKKQKSESGRSKAQGN